MLSPRLNPDYNEIATIAGGRDITRPFINPLGELILPQDELLLAKGGLGWRALELYEKLRQDDQVGACLQQRFTGVVQAEWEVLPGVSRGREVSLADERAADFIRDQLQHSCNFDQVSHLQLWGVFYGYSVAELLYANDGRYIVLDGDREGIRVRDRKRFRFDVNRRPRLVTATGIYGEALPPEKFWVFSVGADHSDDPYGRGLGYWLYWPVWFKRNDLKFWLFFLEKFGQPTAVGRYRVGTSQRDQEELMRALHSILTDAGIILPEGMDVSLLEASRSGTADYSAVYEQMNSAIAKICLSQTMTTDNGSSRSQAEVHAGVAEHVVKSDADLLCASFNSGPVRWLTDLNRSVLGDCAYPQVWRRVEQSEDVDARADREPKLYQVGYVLGAEHLEAIYGQGYQYVGTESDRALISNIFNQVATGALPAESAATLLRTLLPPQLAEKIIPALPAPPMEASPEPDPVLPPTPDAELRAGLETPSIYAARLLEQGLFAPLLARLRQELQRVIADGGSLADFRAYLGRAYSDLDSEALEQALALALTASRFAGLYEAQEGE